MPNLADTAARSKAMFTRVLSGLDAPTLMKFVVGLNTPTAVDIPLPTGNVVTFLVSLSRVDPHIGFVLSRSGVSIRQA